MVNTNMWVDGILHKLLRSKFEYDMTYHISYQTDKLSSNFKKYLCENLRLERKYLLYANNLV